MLTAWVVIPLPFVAVTGFFMARGMYPYYRARQEALADLTAFTQENLNGIRTIQAMAQESHEIGRFKRTSTVYAQKFYRATRYQQFMDVAMSSITTISPLIILFYGGSLVLSGELSVGTWTSFTTYLMMLTHAVTQVGWALSMFVGAAAGTERIYEILDHAPEVTDDPHLEAPLDYEGRLEFRDFTYRHPGAPRPHHRRHSHSRERRRDRRPARAGRFRKIHHPEGGGAAAGHAQGLRLSRWAGTCATCRSTACASWSRWFPRIRSCSPPACARTSPTTIPDAATRPSGNGRGRGRPRPHPARGSQGCAGHHRRRARHHPLRRPEAAGDAGAGADPRRQGAAARRPASPAWTPRRRRTSCAGLQRLRGDKTTLLISHRVSTARHANRIYVIDNGRVLESGSHDELLAKNGYYAELEAVQSKPGNGIARARARCCTIWKWGRTPLRLVEGGA